MVAGGEKRRARGRGHNSPQYHKLGLESVITGDTSLGSEIMITSKTIWPLGSNIGGDYFWGCRRHGTALGRDKVQFLISFIFHFVITRIGPVFLLVLRANGGP